MNTRYFFEKFLRPNVEDWEASPLDERRAMNAILSINQMADWFFHETKCAPSQVASSEDLRKFRDDLAKNECSGFQLIRDVADAHKHFKLGRKSAMVSEAKKTSVQTTRYFAKGYIEPGYFEETDELVVDLGNDDFRTIIVCARHVYQMWERLLAQHGL